MKNLTLIFALLCISVKAQTIDLGLSNMSIGSSSSNKFDRFSGTLIFSTINASMNTMNYINLKRHKEKSNAGFGIITGAIQLTLGTFNHKEKDLQAVDISFGLATIVFSTFCILKKDKKHKEQKLSLALSSPQTPFNKKINGASLLLKF
jgi:hypothetical protein